MKKLCLNFDYNYISCGYCVCEYIIIMESWMLGPPLLIGEKIFYSKNGTTVIPGTVRWLGKLLDCFGNQMVAGLALVG